MPAWTGKCPGCGRELGGIDLGAGGAFVLEGLDAPLVAPPAKAAGATAPATQEPAEDPSVDLDPFEHDMSMVQAHAEPPAAATTAAATGTGALELAVPSRREATLPTVRPVEDLSQRAADTADWGPKPVGLVDAVRYALRVRARKAEMAREIERLAGLHREALRSEAEALAALAGAARAADLPGLEGGVATEARAAEARVAEQTGALTALETQRRERIAEIDRAHDLATKDVPALQAREAELGKAWAEKTEQLKRAETRVKRAEIEIRSRHKLAAERRAGGQSAEADRFVAEVANFETDRAARAAEAGVLRDAALAIERELAEIRRDIAAGLGKGSLILEARRREEEAFRRRQGEGARRVDETAADARDRLAEVGRAILRAQPDAEAIAEPRGAAAASVLARELLERELDVLRIAIQTYDRESVKTGWMVLGAAAAVVALGLAALVFIA